MSPTGLVCANLGEAWGFPLRLFPSHIDKILPDFLAGSRPATDRAIIRRENDCVVAKIATAAKLLAGLGSYSRFDGQIDGRQRHRPLPWPTICVARIHARPAGAAREHATRHRSTLADCAATGPASPHPSIANAAEHSKARGAHPQNRQLRAARIAMFLGNSECRVAQHAKI